MFELIDQLEKNQILSKEELSHLLNHYDSEMSQYLFAKARAVSQKYYGNTVFRRGLIEFTNYCKNDCYYCGIRASNRQAVRYRLSKEEILSCCDTGYNLGFRTFVLQGGEDLHYSDEEICSIILSIKEKFPECAVTLSIGEKSYESYKKYFESGADRYLLRHETSNPDHYNKLHPTNLTISKRKKCLEDLKNIGYQVGTGFMVGSPYQRTEDIVEDLLFIKEFSPAMIGVGPFIPHHQTPFAKEMAGTLELTLFVIGLLRLMNPNALIPATTALGTIDPNGRELGILSGANVVMPNLSPVTVRKNYELYDNKICTGDEAAECKVCLDSRMNRIGYEIVVDRGDFVEI
ncbi:iron-only hydrogenase maturation protein HydE [Alkalibaculum bacchi]|uniref:Iron-only hydrogenase maturation protein HydE n=1 Tax=Alkalibaculum bacchi TaxID=645887 RepID=A0A366I9P3_9FIRM|nr:[FeFe] hydrogenase H-cluster radical SAM maturase HydE [Alkalibaculum bacchi]RBP66661.1 iron-only hydrogenase maturation protein HydE [Alkalibaculum bacchi]